MDFAKKPDPLVSEAQKDTAITPRVEASPAAKPETEAPAAQATRRPIVVFAVDNTLNVPQIQKQFRDEGLIIVFAESEQQIIEQAAKPECFVIFIGLEFEKNGIRVMQKNHKENLAYWVLTTGRLSTQKRTALLQAGAADLLTRPVNAAQYKLRAKSFLSRYLKAFSMPNEVILPEGFARREEVQLQRGQMNDPNNQDGHGKLYDGNYEGDKPRDYNYVKGEQVDGPNVHTHDLSREDNGRDINHHSSKDAAGPASRHHSSADDETRQGSHYRGDDQSDPEWNNHAASRDPLRAKTNPSDTEDKDDILKKSFTFNPRKGAGGLEDFPALPGDPNDKDNSGHPFYQDPAKAPFNSHNSKDAATPFTNHNGEAEKAPSAPRAQHPGPKVTDPARANVPLDRLTDPLALLEAIRQKLIFLRSDIPWDQAVWADASRFQSMPFKGLDQIAHELKGLFKDACHTLGAKKITLLSMRPKLPVSPEEIPDSIHALVSSDGTLGTNDAIATDLMPHLRIAIEEKVPFFLDTKIPEKIGGKSRPAAWKVEGGNELMSVIIPLTQENQVSVALFIQFTAPCDDATIKLLDQCVTYLRVPERHYGTMDFLSRIYRQIENKH